MQVTGNKKIHTYRLSIRICANGFSLSIHQGNEQKPFEKEWVAWSDGVAPHVVLEQILKRERIIQIEYEQVEVLADTPTTRIPLEEFQKDLIRPLYLLTFPTTRTQQVQIQYEILPHLEVVELYAIDLSIWNTILRLYPHAQLHSYQGRILEAEALKEKTWKQNPLHVRQDEQHLFIYSIREGELEFACSYDLTSPSDAIYYTLQVWKELHRDALQDVCMLHQCEAWSQELKKYIKQITVCE